MRCEVSVLIMDQRVKKILSTYLHMYKLKVKQIEEANNLPKQRDSKVDMKSIKDALMQT